MYMQSEGLREVGRRHTRWRDEVRKAARMLGIRSQLAPETNCEEWRKLLEEARTSMSCSANYEFY